MEEQAAGVEWFGTWLPVLVAPFIGSFLGVLVRRLPAGQPVILARSACDHCGRKLRPAELVPLLSFALQRGRCLGCRAPIAWAHPLIELAAAAIALSAALVAADADLWVGCALGWTLLTLSWIDMETMLLPDVLTLPLLVGGLATAWWLDPASLGDRAVGAIAGYLAFRGIELGYRRLRRREGLGEGDAKLLAAAGAWLGWEALPWVVVVAALGGLLAAGVLALHGRRMVRTSVLPFGPMLAAATWAIWLAQGWQTQGGD